jgi:hypothetical protein
MKITSNLNKFKKKEKRLKNFLIFQKIFKKKDNFIMEIQQHRIITVKEIVIKNLLIILKYLKEIEDIK